MPSPRRVAGTTCVALALLSAGIALAQDDPRVPEIRSTYTIDRESGHTEFCIELNADRLAEQIYDVEFTGTWAPPSTTPPGRFGPPGEWQWEAFGGGGWQAKTDVPMELGKRYCFRLPITSVPDPVTLTASTKTASGQHQQYLTFLSRPPDYRSALGDVPRTFTLGAGAVAAAGVLRPADRACRPNPIEAEFTLATPQRGRLTIHRSGTDTAFGRVDARGHFTAAGELSSYVGRINGRLVVLGYRDGRRPACEQSYTGSLNLERAGRAAPLCSRPTVVAPTRARVIRGSRVELRLAATCAGARLARWPMQITLRWRGRTFKVGSFRTLLSTRSVGVRLGDTRPTELVIRAAGGQGLGAAVKRIRLVYP